MPIVGGIEANDTFVEQIDANARAAIDKLVDIGVADRRRVGVGGYSYGAFMVANLLAHTDWFAGGVAMSGAYNRTLTPFGFQRERRTLWDVPDVYLRMSPFMYADRIDDPLLLIHGLADSNSGTYPMQSTRLFHAISGLGGVSRLVMMLVVAYSAVAAVPTADQVRALDALMSDWDGTTRPGCAVSLVRAGEPYLFRTYGMADIEQDVPITAETRFYIASTSKQFTAMSVLLASEQGYLSLDDDIRMFVPEIPDYGQRITIRHLVWHTSGLRDYLRLWGLAGRSYLDEMTEEEVLDLPSRQRGLTNGVGEAFAYSNSGYFVLGLIVRRATGRSLADFAERNIFGPLGMTHSVYHDDLGMLVPNIAQGYSIEADGSVHKVTGIRARSTASRRSSCDSRAAI